MTGGFREGKVYGRINALSNDALQTPTCPRCGYAAVGLTQPICPECGNDLAESGVVIYRSRVKWVRWALIGVWSVLVLFGYKWTLPWVREHVLPQKCGLSENVMLDHSSVVDSNSGITIARHGNAIYWPWQHSLNAPVDLLVIEISDRTQKSLWDQMRIDVRSGRYVTAGESQRKKISASLPLKDDSFVDWLTREQRSGHFTAEQAAFVNRIVNATMSPSQSINWNTPWSAANSDWQIDELLKKISSKLGPFQAVARSCELQSSSDSVGLAAVPMGWLVGWLIGCAILFRLARLRNRVIPFTLNLPDPPRPS